MNIRSASYQVCAIEMILLWFRGARIDRLNLVVIVKYPYINNLSGQEQQFFD